MGCSSSVAVSPAPENNNEPSGKRNNSNIIRSISPEHKPKQHLTGKGVNSTAHSGPNIDAPRGGIAFDVSLDGRRIDGLIMKHPPKKLQRLEPINHPKMSAAMLLEKQRLADEKREQELQKKRELSQKTSRRRRDLLKAREFEMEQTTRQVSHQIESQLKTAEMIREAKQQRIVEKQKMREERAQRVRRKAKRLEEENQDEQVELEADQHFNGDDDEDIWNDGYDYENSRERTHSYSSRPVKAAGLWDDKRPRRSTSSVDSVDNAFMNAGKRGSPQQDDFFDTPPPP